MKVKRFTRVDDLADAVVSELEAAVTRNPKAVIGWPSGRTTVPILRSLARQEPRFSLAGATVAMMDDYALPTADGFRNADPDAHCSCQHWVDAELVPALSRWGAPTVLIPDAADPASFENQLDSLGGVDLFLVGVGSSDAHIAFNPPGTPADSRTRVIELAQTTRRDNLSTFPDFRNLDEVPTHGVTVGLATITGARKVLGIAHGAGKAQIARKVIEADGFTTGLPATAFYLNSTTEFLVAALDEEEKA